MTRNNHNDRIKRGTPHHTRIYTRRCRRNSCSKLR